MPGPADERIPPHDLDAERALLGSMLLSADAIDAAQEVGPSTFYAQRHGAVYAEIVALHDAGEPVDVVTVANRLGGRLGAGKDFLHDVISNTPASANAKAYAE